MSELKAYKGDIYIPVYGSIADAEVYLKSEADKVIAHQKYKRCLAMANNCALEVYRLRKLYRTSEIENQQSYLLKKIYRRNRWREYLQQLAEKFKEAK